MLSGWPAIVAKLASPHSATSDCIIMGTEFRPENVRPSGLYDIS